MAGEHCPACAAFADQRAAGMLLVMRELAGAWHADVSADRPEEYVGRIDIHPRRHVSRWAGLRPSEAAALDSLTVELSIALHRVAGAVSVRPVNVGHDESGEGHLCRQLIPEYPAPLPAWLDDPRWQDPDTRPQAVLDLVERLRAQLTAAPPR